MLPTAAFFVVFAAVAISGSIVLSVVSIWLLRQHTRLDYTKPFLGMLFCMAIWSGLSGVRVLLQTLHAKIIVFTMLSIGAIFLAPFWLHFAVKYTNKWDRKHKALVYIGYGTAGVFSLIMITNPFHHLYWTHLQVVDIGWRVLARDRTLLYWASYVWAYAYVLGSIILVGYYSLETNELHDHKLAVYVFGPFIPIIFELTTSLGLTPRLVDLTPIGFTIWGFLLVYVFYSHTLHNVAPIGRKFAFESIQTPILIYDQHGSLTDWNDQSTPLLVNNPGGNEWMDAFNHQTRESLMEQIGDVITTVTEKTHPQDAIEERTLDEITLPVNDEERTYNIQFTPITPDGNTRGFVIMFDDVTSMVEHRNAVEAKNERLEQFASIVSHDLRNPISVAHGFVDMIDDNEDAVTRIQDALTRMEDIINEILVLAREEDAITKTDTVNIHDTATAAWDLVNTFDGTLELRIDPDFEVRADQGYIQTVFENLFRNVYDHCQLDTTVYIGELEDQTGFFVADDGPGIPDDERDQIFDEGYTTSDNGNGLGLYIVKMVIDSHGWTITLDTDTDTFGTKFDIVTETSDTGA